MAVKFNMETYRSGHNGADSKSVREQSPASSNLAVSAIKGLQKRYSHRRTLILSGFFLFYEQNFGHRFERAKRYFYQNRFELS